jgi:iron-sulfur cluster repair protein YtfE (RIC family)
MPIKRNESLVSLSREHHFGLLFCWKIRMGLRKNIEANRIRSYAEWFYSNYLIPHFLVEEKYVFPILGDENKLVRRALSDHRRLRRLFEGVNEINKNIGLIEEKLEEHIRFEERILFNEIENAASAEALATILNLHSSHSHTNQEWGDEFWK